MLSFLFLLILLLFGYSFFSLPRENYRSYRPWGDPDWHPENVIVKMERIDYNLDLNNNEIVFAEGYEKVGNYNVLLPSELLSQNIEDISLAGRLIDKEGRFYLFFSYEVFDQNKFIIKDVQMILTYNQPDKYGILEMKEIKEIGIFEENLTLFKLIFGISFCFLLIATIFSFDEWLYGFDLKQEYVEALILQLLFPLLEVADREYSQGNYEDAYEFFLNIYPIYKKSMEYVRIFIDEYEDTEEYKLLLGKYPDHWAIGKIINSCKRKSEEK